MPGWTPGDIPDLTGKTAVVTGATSGIGETAATALAGKGAGVVLAVRNADKAEATRQRILRRFPQAVVRSMLVDLTDLASIREFADHAVRALPQIDILVNNAGLGMQPKRTLTTDGFERQFGTNHLAPFALTGLVLPALLRAPRPRVVAIASIAHRSGRIALDDLQGERHYGGLKAYQQSKLANLMYAFELDKRARTANARLTSVAAHPGISTTGFIAASEMPSVVRHLGNALFRVVGQDAEKGAWPGLYAATMPDVSGGDYWGPDGIGEIRGYPKRAAVAPHARDADTAARLWAASEALTGITYRFTT